MNLRFNLSFFIFMCVTFLFPISCIASENKECVILLHGLARSHASMSKMELFLKKNGYMVVNENYPSTKEPIAELSEKYIPLMINQCLIQHASRIYFVTHSMGGIVLEAYLQNHYVPRLSRIVMLGPPNHGSELVDLLHGNYFFKYFTGPAGQELSTSKNSVPNSLHLKNLYQIGVIAGSSDIIPFSNYIFHEPNDGKVTISSTKMNYMSDFIVLPVSHTFMMKKPVVLKQILSFIRLGRFVH